MKSAVGAPAATCCICLCLQVDAGPRTAFLVSEHSAASPDGVGGRAVEVPAATGTTAQNFNVVVSRTLRPLPMKSPLRLSADWMYVSSRTLSTVSWNV